MPYEIRKYGRAYKVYKKGTAKSYSKGGLTQRKAERQLKALYADADDDMEGGGFFGSLITKAFSKVSDLIVRPPNWNPSKVKYGWTNRPINMPSLQDLSEMAASTYTNEEDSTIDGYYLWDKTPTISIFGVEKTIGLFVIALRGTSFRDINDITADLSIVKGIVEDASNYRAIRNGNRWREDTTVIANFKKFVENYLHIPNATYYAVGHSLSGAIIDELLEDGIVSSAVSFNPAIERQNFNLPNNNHRVYLECDILYNLLGKFITNGNIEVIQKANPSGPDAGPIDTVKGTVECHNIKTVIPYMVGKGDNNIHPIYNNMSRSSFFDTIQRPSFGALDRFKPIGSPCDSILQEMVTQDVGPNSGRERQRRRYEACLANNGKEPEAPQPPPPRYYIRGPYDDVPRRPSPNFGVPDSVRPVRTNYKFGVQKGMEGTGFLSEMLAEGLYKGAKGLYNLHKSSQGGAYGRGFAGDMWRRGKKDLGFNEPEPDTSHPISDYTNRDAVEKRFYGV
jgi:hypothetical protein